MLRDIIGLLWMYRFVRDVYKYMPYALLHNSLNLHFDSINFSAMISALCRKGNLLEVTLRRSRHGIVKLRQTNEKRLSSIIRETRVSRDHVCRNYGTGILAVARSAKTEYTCNVCERAFISFRSYVIARSIVACYSLIKIPAINSMLNCGNN